MSGGQSREQPFPDDVCDNEAYDVTAARREWAHDLASGTAAALNLFDPPEINEALLATVLRKTAAESDDLGNALFLRAMADALDHPTAALRLRLGKNRRGRPTDKGVALNRAMVVGPLVAKLQMSGWKKEAAIQAAMSELDLSRSSVLRACAQYGRLTPIIDSIQVAADEVKRRKFTKSGNI